MRSKGDHSGDFITHLAFLRGAAVLLVLLFHTGMPGFGAGYLGVDIFFVLSGYLITITLLKNDFRTVGGFFKFYWNRLLRLFPALILLCATLYLIAPWLALRHVVSTDIAAAVTYVSNWTRVEWPSLPAYLGHTWSLSIEEQFYFAWPILLGILLRFGGIKQAAAGALIFALASAAMRALATWHGATSHRLYNSFDLRADALLLGCALALYTFRDESALRSIAKLARPALIVLLPCFAAMLAVAPYDAAWMFSIGYLVAGVTTTALIAVLIYERPFPWAFQFAPILYLGEISYGVYLWHYPLTVEFSRLGLDRYSKSLAVLVLSIALASLSLYLVERPLSVLRKANFSVGLGAASLVVKVLAFGFGIWLFWG